MSKKILVVTTNVDNSPDGKIFSNGVWLEEFAVPYLIFKGNFCEISVASPNGGLAPVDENSMSCSNPMEWDECIKILRNTQKLSEINYENFDAIFLPGGHGPMYDLANDKFLAKVIEYFYNTEKIISAVCHGPAGLLLAQDKWNTSILKNKKVTCFTDDEEKIVKYSDLIPFSLETKIRELGANFIAKKPWAEHVEIDGNIITGQNPASAILVAEKVIEKLNI